MSKSRLGAPKPSTAPSKRGLTILSVVGSLFVTALVLSGVVPLYLTAQRQADAARDRSRTVNLGRELTAQFRVDVHQAAKISAPAGGRSLTLVSPTVPAGSKRTVLYRWERQRLRREVLSGAGVRLELMEYSRPLAGVHFRRAGMGVEARFRFAALARTGVPFVELSATSAPRVVP